MGIETQTENTDGRLLTSVIIVSYNTRDLLTACVKSIYASKDVPEPQVIIVDNGSSDGSPQAIRETFPQSIVIEAGENLGFSKANNLGMAEATGEYILLLNPDTVLQPDVLADMTEYMNNNPDIGMASCKLVTGDGSLDLACRRSFPSLWDGFCRASGLSALFPHNRFFARYNLTFLDENETNEVEAVNGAFMFCRREAVDKVGPLDEDYFMYIEDLDWCYRFGKAGWKVVYHPATTTIHYKGQSGNPRSDRMIRELFKSTEIFYRKHCFPVKGYSQRTLILVSLRLWKWTSLFKNAIRKKKRTRP